MKASICALAAVLVASAGGPALAKAPPAKAPARTKAAPVKAPVRHAARHRAHAIAEQAWATGHCKVTLPGSWSDWHGGKADPKDRGFNVTLGHAGDPKAMVSAVKAMRGKVLSDKPDLVLMQVEVRGRGSRQFWAVTRPGPGCRATVTFSDHEVEAKKIAQSLKKGR